MHPVMSLVHSLQQSISHITGCAKTSDREVNACSSVIRNQQVMVTVSEHSKSLIRKVTNGQDPICPMPPAPPLYVQYIIQTFTLMLSSHTHRIPQWSLERICSQTQLCQLRCFNDYTRELHVSAPTGHLQVVFKRT
jgi:hypothetical protein